MDEKLTKFRQNKARQEMKRKLENQGKQILSAIRRTPGTLFDKLNRQFSKMDQELKESKCDLSQELLSSDNSETDEILENKEEENSWPFINKLSIFLLWIILYAFFIYIGFGAVYFCVTALFFICFNTRTYKKNRNEISAYSVFNKNCENIDGTFTAEQFDKQLRTGMM